MMVVRTGRVLPVVQHVEGITRVPDGALPPGVSGPHDDPAQHPGLLCSGRLEAPGSISQSGTR